MHVILITVTFFIVSCAVLWALDVLAHSILFKKYEQGKNFTHTLEVKMKRQA